MIEELKLLAEFVSPTVIVLVYLVYKLDKRIEELTETIIDIARGNPTGQDFKQ